MRFVVRTAVAALVASLLPAVEAHADTFKVNKLGDPVPGACTNGHCTLREAVLAANNGSPGRDTVLLPNRKKRYQLQLAGGDEDGGLTGDLDVTNDALTIKHKGRGVATIHANGIDRVIEAFETLALTRIKVTGGDATPFGNEDGGGIQAQKTLVMRRSRVSGNHGDDGGGIHHDGSGGTPTVRLVRSVVAGNVSKRDGAGMKLGLAGTKLAIVRSRISGNDASGGPTAQGGAISLSTGGIETRIVRSTLAGNTAVGSGGAIIASALGTLRIKYSTLSGNRSGSDGGALFLHDVNAAIVNSTVYGNRAAREGGGIFADGTAKVTLNAATVARNVANTDEVPPNETGGGLATETSLPFRVRNSLIALNRLGGGTRNDCTGNFDSGGGNLLSTRGPGGTCDGFDAPQDRVRGKPKIGKLGRNGGPTKTVALKKGSPAIGNARKSAPNRDQRRRKRDRNPDSGAFERGA